MEEFEANALDLMGNCTQNVPKVIAAFEQLAISAMEAKAKDFGVGINPTAFKPKPNSCFEQKNHGNSLQKSATSKVAAFGDPVYPLPSIDINFVTSAPNFG